jgi:hypothetical protein
LPLWFFNPANSYSPLAGSTFVAWLMGPMGNDVLARFVEAPALVFLFLGVAQLSRALGASITVAAFLGLAVACARPFISQTILAKDDLPLAAFLVAAMVALSTDRLRDPLGPWRLGAAVGLLMATKFTATFSLPVILLAIDAPWRSGWRWKKHLIAAGVAICLFGPWYARNWICYGSPAFPFNITAFGIHLFDGPLTTIKTDRMNDLRGIIQTLTGTYYSLPWMLGIVVVVAWVISLWHGQPARDFASPGKDTGGPPVPQPQPQPRATSPLRRMSFPPRFAIPSTAPSSQASSPTLAPKAIKPSTTARAAPSSSSSPAPVYLAVSPTGSWPPNSSKPQDSTPAPWAPFAPNGSSASQRTSSIALISSRTGNPIPATLPRMRK